MKKTFIFSLSLFASLTATSQNTVFATFECSDKCNMQNESTAHPGQQALIAYYNTVARGPKSNSQTTASSASSTAQQGGAAAASLANATIPGKTGSSTTSEVIGSASSQIVFLKAPGLNSEMFASLFYAGKTFSRVTFYFYNSANQLVFTQAIGSATISGIQRVAGENDGSPFVEKYTITYSSEFNTVFDSASGVVGKNVNAQNTSTGRSITYGFDFSTEKVVKQ